MPLVVNFAATAGPAGFDGWLIESIAPVIGDTLPDAQQLWVSEGEERGPAGAVWTLTGETRDAYYVTPGEAAALRAKQEGLGRDSATRAALIPVRKSAAWWALPQAERRAIMEERSHHIAIGLDYLPAIARRLHHCRRADGSEAGAPFDFLTWFEYAPEHEAAFEELVARLRGTEEWRYVAREVDVRLAR